MNTLRNLPHQHKHGFTIVEMLVVIGIIAILIGMLLPALSGVQDRNRKMREMAQLRTVGTAWVMYSNANNETILPGYLSDDVIDRWRIRIELPTELPSQVTPGIPDDPGTGGAQFVAGPGNDDSMGTAVQELFGNTWSWRLMPYFDFDYDTVLGYMDSGDRSPSALVNDRQFVARHPAFGYNAFYFGGWWEIDTALRRPQYRFSNARVAGGDADAPRVNVVVRSMANIRRPNEVIVFSPSTEQHHPGPNRNIRDNHPGSHLVTPPVLAMEPQWGYGDGTVLCGQNIVPGGGTGSASDNNDDIHWVHRFATPTHAPLGRYNDQVPILYADGSAHTMLPGSMVDQRMWIDAASVCHFAHTDDED